MNMKLLESQKALIAFQFWWEEPKEKPLDVKYVYVPS